MQRHTLAVLTLFTGVATGLRDRLSGATLVADTNLVRSILEQYHNRIEISGASNIDVNARDDLGRTPIMLCGLDPQAAPSAVDLACGEIGQMLIREGCDTAAVDNAGWSVVAYAVLSGWSTLLPRLVESGADFSNPNPQGLLPLPAAAMAGHVSTVEALLETGACDAWERSEVGWTSLFYAVKGSSAASDSDGDGRFQRVFDTLLERARRGTTELSTGSPPFVDVADDSGRTALMVAAAANAKAAVEWLLAVGGADPSLSDTNGKSALAHAQHPNGGAVRLLLSEALVVSAEAAHSAWEREKEEGATSEACTAEV
jgi:ankyrin repeat protein